MTRHKTTHSLRNLCMHNKQIVVLGDMLWACMLRELRVPVLDSPDLLSTFHKIVLFYPLSATHDDDYPFYSLNTDIGPDTGLHFTFFYR